MTTTLAGKSALVVGASSGVGRATLVALAGQGVRVTGVARNRERLERIVREAPGEAVARIADAADPETARRLIDELAPDLIVLSAGARARLAPLDEHSWESFSEPWNTDVKLSFHFGQEAVRKPLRPGSVVVMISSGAAIGGSPLSGGYAGAKRMQWFMAGYLDGLAKKRGLGIRFVALVPRQMIAGTEIAEAASSAYAASAGISQEAFMARFGAPLLAEGVADAVLRIARGELGDATAYGVTGTAVEPI